MLYLPISINDLDFFFLLHAIINFFFVILLGIGGYEGKSAEIEEEVAFEAQEALEFLNGREKFWDQIDLGSDKKKSSIREKKACESFRWLM